jgi:hypothetical protein
MLAAKRRRQSRLEFTPTAPSGTVRARQNRVDDDTADVNYGDAERTSRKSESRESTAAGDVNDKSDTDGCIKEVVAHRGTFGRNTLRRKKNRTHDMRLAFIFQLFRQPKTQRCGPREYCRLHYTVPTHQVACGPALQILKWCTTRALPWVVEYGRKSYIRRRRQTDCCPSANTIRSYLVLLSYSWLH